MENIWSKAESVRKGFTPLNCFLVECGHLCLSACLAGYHGGGCDVSRILLAPHAHGMNHSLCVAAHWLPDHVCTCFSPAVAIWLSLRFYLCSPCHSLFSSSIVLLHFSVFYCNLSTHTDTHTRRYMGGKALDSLFLTL